VIPTHVFAFGARVCETPLPVPLSKICDQMEAYVLLPSVRNQRRKMFRRLPFGYVTGLAPLCMDSNDPHTIDCAFKQRLLRDIPVPKDGFLPSFKRFVRDYVKENLPKIHVMSFEEWLNSTDFNDARKRELIAAHDMLLGGKPTRRQCSHICTFVKTENYDKYKHARMINSRCDAFKVWSGPMFKSIEEQVYQIGNFIKHVPVADRPACIKELKQAGRKYYQTDFTAFESHFVAELMDACECELYRGCLSDYPSDAKWLCDAICGRNNMSTRTGIKAVVKARRMSGDMCTSLGNGWTNLMLVKYIVHLKHGEVDGFVEGDDGLFASTVPLTIQDYADCGFSIKIIEVDDPCSASFCGMIFSESGQIIRDPVRFLCKFGWTHSDINAGPKVMNGLLRAKALSTLYETPHCPIVSVIAHVALGRTRNFSPRFVSDGYHHLPKDEIKITPFLPTMDTRLLFEKEFGISIDAQLHIENEIIMNRLEGIGKYFDIHSDLVDYSSKFVGKG